MTAARRLLVALAATAAASCAGAQTVSLQGMLAGRPLLVIDGGTPRSVAVGDTVQGVKVLSAGGEQAVVEIAGQRQTLRMGEAPGATGRAPARMANRIVLFAGTGGHYLAQGSINGHSTQFLVDTGATLVSLGAAEADRLGLDYKTGEPGRVSTANGTVRAWRVRLSSVRIGEVEVPNVEAVVSPQEMPYVLLGNSFLNRFKMRRDNEQMVLERKF